MKRSAIRRCLVMGLVLAAFAMLGRAEALEKVKDIQFVTGNAGGAWGTMGAVIADRTNAKFDGFPINSVPGGAVANVPLLVRNEAQLGLSQGVFLGSAMIKEAPYKDLENAGSLLRAICSLVPTPSYFIVAEEVPGKTFKEVLDNTGKIRFGMNPPGNSSTYLTEYVLQQYGYKNGMNDLKKKGAKVIFANQASLKDSWSDGHINIFVISTNLPSTTVSELLTVRKSRLVPLDPDVIKKLTEENGFIEMDIPANTYPGQNSTVKGVGVSTVLFARADLPDSVAYQLAKVIYTEKSSLEAVQASFKNFDVKDMVNGLILPVHTGAQKFYKEVGLMK